MDIKERKAWGSLNRGNPFYKQGLAFELASVAYDIAGQESGEIDLFITVIIKAAQDRDWGFLNGPGLEKTCELINLNDEITLRKITDIINGEY